MHELYVSAGREASQRAAASLFDWCQKRRLGMVSQATLEAFEKSDPPVRYIVGMRMRRQKEVNTSVLGSHARWFESVPQRTNAKDPAPLKVKEVWVKERRYIVCLNEEERRKDAHDREAIVAHLRSNCAAVTKPGRQQGLPPLSQSRR